MYEYNLFWRAWRWRIYLGPSERGAPTKAKGGRAARGASEGVFYCCQRRPLDHRIQPGVTRNSAMGSAELRRARLLLVAACAAASPPLAVSRLSQPPRREPRPALAALGTLRGGAVANSPTDVDVPSFLPAHASEVTAYLTRVDVSPEHGLSESRAGQLLASTDPTSSLLPRTSLCGSSLPRSLTTSSCRSCCAWRRCRTG